ncbi:hypothetical protein [Brucella tritici]|uniref:Uncharacterized protein n=1 Tax=Brucella tritici TaxID=94626 RepID=A0A6L3Y9D5_9HYPH|nr:hypothetical protein [Brucella tritici]KAB2675763.1 hypothetical protein F9L08_27465 [Brucella tritici]
MSTSFPFLLSTKAPSSAYALRYASQLTLLTFSCVISFNSLAFSGIYLSDDPEVARLQQQQYEYFKTQCPDDRSNDPYGDKYYQCVQMLYDNWDRDRKNKLDSRPSDSSNKVTTERQKSITNTQSQTEQRVAPWAKNAKSFIVGRLESLKKPKKSKANKNENDTQAPYADSKCAQIKPRANRGLVDWDSVAITNTCKFPIEVITCYYDKGAENKCTLSNTGAWGSPGRIQPGGKIASVSDTRTPQWKVKYVVCNMSGVNNHSKLCLLPKG